MQPQPGVDAQKKYLHPSRSGEGLRWERLEQLGRVGEIATGICEEKPIDPNWPKQMRRTVQWGAVAVWHHRLFGGLWGLCGLSLLCITILRVPLSEYQSWIAVLISLTYAIAGFGFARGRTWARRTMAVLMVPASLVFLDMLLLGGWSGNHDLIWQMLVAIGIAAYTFLFLIISAAWHANDAT